MADQKQESTEVALQDREPQDREPQDRELIRPEQGAIALGDCGIVLKTLDEVWQLAAIIHKSNIAPKGFCREDVFGVLATGFELGLSPMMSLNCIYVVNNRTSVWGDAVPGLVEKSGLLEWEKVEEVGTYPTDDYGFRHESKRKGRDPKSWTYTIADAKTAKLWSKSGPWTTDPKRMLMYRARTFNYRDNFPDALKGLHTVDEVTNMVDADYEVEDDRTQTQKLEGMVAPQAAAESQESPDTPQEVPDAETGSGSECEQGGIFDEASKEQVQPASPDDNMPFKQ